MTEQTLHLLADIGNLEARLVEAGATAQPQLKRFSMNAYNGGAMELGWAYPVAIDLSGLKVTARSRPILHQHDPSQIVGHTDAVEVHNGSLRVSGLISAATPVASMIVESAANGFPWQASIGARVQKTDFVAEGQVAEANGRKFSGPVYIVRRSSLGEVSFVALGADDSTVAKVAASLGRNTMNEPNPTVDTPAPEPTYTAGTVAAQMRAEALQEAERLAAIRKATAGNAEIEAKAIAEGWDATRAELEVLRASRPVMGAPAAHVHSREINADVITAAICKAGRLANLEDAFDAPTLEAADRSFRKGVGLQETLLEAAWANGYTGRSLRSDMRGVLQAAFSNLSLPGIFSSVANKFLLAGFMGVEQTWRSLASIRSVADFKTVTSYRLNGAFEYEEVGNGGELRHGAVGEESFTNQAKTYGKMFSVTRQDIINDDLGALTALPSRIGRGGALKLNGVFWSTFLNNSTFFASGNNNYASGATTALSIDSLTTAEQKFLDLTDGDGKPMALSPSILLVPTALNAKAATLMNSTEIRDNTSGAKYVTNNPHAGKFTTVYSAYLSNASFTGNSSTAWYLMANPSDISSIEVAFLNGVESPTVESTDADFSTLGIQMRGYFDFGVALQDYRAGVKMAGA
jgi:hypothetical protein